MTSMLDDLPGGRVAALDGWRGFLKLRRVDARTLPASARSAVIGHSAAG